MDVSEIRMAPKAATDLAVREQWFGVMKLGVEEDAVVDNFVRLL